MLLDLGLVGIAVLDGVAHAPEQADAGIADVGEDHLLRHAHADHLVVEHVGRHADQREIAKALADGLVAGGVGDEVGEPLERDGVAVVEVILDRLGKADELRHAQKLRL